jgi:purine-binding chemotaxis protein CheW
MISPKNPAAKKPTDWTETRQRLAAIQQRLDQSWTPAPEEKTRVLEARARLLARESEDQTPAGDHFDVVEFLLAHEKYGIATSCVREVYPLVELTPLPRTPPFVLGVANVRGHILSVMDIKRFFDLPEKGLTDLNKLIIVRVGDMELGILADAIHGVRAVAAEALQPQLPTLTGIRADYLRGLTEDSVAVLDIERILDDERIVVDGRTNNGG